jgi:hypothetical protein
MSWCLAASIVIVRTATSDAQIVTDPPLMPPHAFEVSSGLEWFGGFDLGGRTALLPRNPSTGSEPFTLFASEGEQGAFPAGFLTIGYHLTDTVLIEATGSVSRPRPEISISSDAELPAGAIVKTEGLTEFTVGGAAVVHLKRMMIGTRALPYVRGGVEIIRQLQGGALQNGWLYHAGGGVRYVFTSRNRRPTTMGVRAEVRLNVRDGGFELADDRRAYVSMGAGLFLTF